MLTKFTFKIIRQDTEVLSVSMDIEAGCINIDTAPVVQTMRMRGPMVFPSSDPYTVERGDKIILSREERVE